MIPATYFMRDIILYLELVEKHKEKQKTKEKVLGNDLLSRGVAPQVPSALTGLTTGFEMLPGVSPPLQSPRTFS